MVTQPEERSAPSEYVVRALSLISLYFSSIDVVGWFTEALSTTDTIVQPTEGSGAPER